MFNNYTGDRLNFGIAIERARAEGIKIGVLINGDDCAIDKVTGRRGLNGGICNMKVLTYMHIYVTDTGYSIQALVHVGVRNVLA